MALRSIVMLVACTAGIALCHPALGRTLNGNIDALKMAIDPAKGPPIAELCAGRSIVGVAELWEGQTAAVSAGSGASEGRAPDPITPGRSASRTRNSY